MDGFFGWADRWLQSVVWRSMLAHFQWVDWSAVIFFSLGLLYGARRGLMREIVEVLEMVFILYCVIEFFTVPETLLNTYLVFIPNTLTRPIAFLLTIILVWLAVALIDRLFQKLIRTQSPAFLRIVGGACLGAVHFLIILSLISQVALLLPWDSVVKSYRPENSFTGHYLARLAPRIDQWVVGFQNRMSNS